MLYNDRFIATFFIVTNETLEDTSLAESVMGIGQIVSLLGITLAVIVLAYYSTKFIAKNRLAGAKSSNMKILESISLGFQNVLYLVKVGEKCFCISASKDKVTFLTEVDADSLDFSDNTVKKQTPPFETVLSAFIEKHKKRGKGDEK